MERRQITEIVEKALTHAGIFHADDVFAAAVLELVFPDIIIERAKTVPDHYDGLIFDIGAGKYDHHQGEKKLREDSIRSGV